MYYNSIGVLGLYSIRVVVWDHVENAVDNCLDLVTTSSIKSNWIA